MSRREFTRNQKEQIVERAKDSHGDVHCERCGLSLKKGSWEIDHILAEALRPEADKQKKITIVEGQLLGKACCHRGEDGKTNDDVKLIAKAKRQYNGANGIKRPKQTIKSAPFPSSEKAEKRSSKMSLPPRQLYQPINSGLSTGLQNRDVVE